MQQWTFALISAPVFDYLLANMVQTTGETVTVIDNEGNEVEVPKAIGGYCEIFRTTTDPAWVGLLGTTLGPALDQFKANIGQAGIELVRLSDGWPELDQEMDTDTLTALNAWLAAQGVQAVAAGTNRQCIEAAFGQFVSGFRCSDYMVM